MYHQQSHMAVRSFSQALARVSPSPTTTIPLKIKSNFPYRLLSHRNQSTIHVADIIDSSSSEAIAVQKIEDAIHRMIVRRSEPDWLPFLPGSSYWVPPRRKSYGVAQIVRQLSNPLTDDEVMSLSTVRGWPSSSFFIHEASVNSSEVETPSTQLSQAEAEAEDEG